MGISWFLFFFVTLYRKNETLMNKITNLILIALLSVFSTQFSLAQQAVDKFALYQNGGGDTLIICTKKIGKDIKGYNRDTPVKIFVKGDKIVKVEAMSNRETPEYFKKVKAALMDKWNGLTLKQAKSHKVDAITGATYSSRAIIETVQRGVEYRLAGKEQ